MIPLDAWVEENCPDLQAAIVTHVQEMSDMDPIGRSILVRMIMTSVRQEFGGRDYDTPR